MAAARNLGQTRLSSVRTRPHRFQGKVGRGFMLPPELIAGSRLLGSTDELTAARP